MNGILKKQEKTCLPVASYISVFKTGFATYIHFYNLMSGNFYGHYSINVNVLLVPIVTCGEMMNVRSSYVHKVYPTRLCHVGLM